MANPEPDLYLVRIWRGGNRFRAVARRVDEDSQHCMSSAQELVAYLAGHPTTEPAATSPAPRQALEPAATHRENTP